MDINMDEKRVEQRMTMKKNGAEVTAGGQETCKAVSFLQFYGADDHFGLFGIDVFTDRTDGVSVGRRQPQTDECNFCDDLARMRGLYAVCRRTLFPA